MKGERGKTKLAGDKPGSGTSVFVGYCASEVLSSAMPAEFGDGVPSDSIDTRHTGVLGIVEAPKNGLAGIRPLPPPKATGLIA